MPSYVMFVDGLGTTGSNVPRKLHQKDVKCIYIASPGKKADYLMKGFVKEDFVLVMQGKRNVDGSTDIESIRKELLAHHIDFTKEDTTLLGVVAGVDSGVRMKDEISHAFGVKQNDPKDNKIRWDKAAMAEALRGAGLAYIPHLEVPRDKTKIDTAITSQEIAAMKIKIMMWLQEHKIKWPIIIKPTDGAGTEGLSLCQREADLEKALRKLFDMTCFLGHKFTGFLAQPYIVGREYCVNTMSVEKDDKVIHRVTDIWTSVKQRDSENIIYDYMQLLSHAEPPEEHAQPVKELVEYIMLALDAWGVKHGPGHTELIYTEDDRAVAIEFNGRIMGLGIKNEKQQEALPYTQIDAEVDLLTDANTFLKNTEHPYKLKKHLACVLHQVPYENCVVDPEAIRQYINQETIPTFAYHKFTGEGSVPKTRDLINTVGWVLLTGDNQEDIDRDMAKVRELEKTKLFVPNPALQKQPTIVLKPDTRHYYPVVRYYYPSMPVAVAPQPIPAAVPNSSYTTTAVAIAPVGYYAHSHRYYSTAPASVTPPSSPSNYYYSSPVISPSLSPTTPTAPRSYYYAPPTTTASPPATTSPSKNTLQA